MTGAVPEAVPETIHATCVSLDGEAALLCGVPGAGKSDLAFRLIAQHGWRLVADDRTVLARDGDRLLARAPASLTGLLEVRGLGLWPVEPVAAARVCLVAELVAATDVPRLPDLAHVEFSGVRLPLIRLAPFEASAPLKLALAMRTIGRGGFPGTDGRLG